MYNRFLFLVFIIFISHVTVFAVNDTSSSLEITNAWARKSLSSNSNSAAYMKIHNSSNHDYVITAASAASIADNVELHKSFVDERGISRMVSLDKIVVPAKSTIELKPGAIHIMLLDLKKSLHSGDKFKLDLQVEGAENITTKILVK